MQENYEMQDSALYRAMISGDCAEVFKVASPEMFAPGARMELAFMLSRLQDRKDLAMAVMEEARRTGNGNVTRLIPDIATVGALAKGGYYANFVAADHARRLLLQIAVRLAEQAKTLPPEELYSLKDVTSQALLSVHVPGAVIEDDAWDLDFFTQLEQGDAQVHVPEHADTGGEVPDGRQGRRRQVDTRLPDADGGVVRRQHDEPRAGTV